MGWEPPKDASTPEKLSDWWLGTCRKHSSYHQLFVSLGWGDRLSLLFAIACCRAAFGERLNTHSRAVLDLRERYADGHATLQEVIAVADAMMEVPDGHFGAAVVHQSVSAVATMTPAFAAGWMAGRRRDRELFGKILRAMVGPGMPWSDAWRTDTAVLLAQGIYDDQAWDRFPLLSDALQDAGCDDHRVIGYCRGEGPFCRGCWLLDMLLAKR
jgi:hypothetical protein